MMTNIFSKSCHMGIVSCYLVLFSVNECVILTSYLWGYKGGRCDRYGRTVTYRGGGSQENPLNALYHPKISEEWSNSSNQDGRWNMAREGIRSECLSRKADVPQTRGKQITLSVAESTPVDFQPASIDSCSATLLPFCHMATEMARG